MGRARKVPRCSCYRPVARSRRRRRASPPPEVPRVPRTRAPRSVFARRSARTTVKRRESHARTVSDRVVVAERDRSSERHFRSTPIVAGCPTRVSFYPREVSSAAPEATLTARRRSRTRETPRTMFAVHSFATHSSTAAFRPTLRRYAPRRPPPIARATWPTQSTLASVDGPPRGDGRARRVAHLERVSPLSAIPRLALALTPSPESAAS